MLNNRKGNYRKGTGVPFVLKRYRVPRQYEEEVVRKIKALLKEYRAKSKTEKECRRKP